MPGSLAAGQLVDERYALDEHLAEDSLGTIWRAYDRGLQREVVLRDVHFPGGAFSSEPSRLREALTAARGAIRLDHPGAVHVYDAFVDGDQLVIVTELFPGRSLASMVERKGALPPKRVAAIALDMLSPLEALHALGLAHGALAPTSVIVPEKGRARLTELGLAPSFKDAASVTWAHAAGTPNCLAPEQLRHEGNSPAADMWALGATLYWAVEGKHAFGSVEAIPSEPPRPPSRAGAALWSVLERLLAKWPADRPAPADIRADLAAIAGVPAGGEEEAERRRSRRGRRRAAVVDDPIPPQDDEGAPESSVTADADAERDWTAVVTGDAAPDLRLSDEPAWQDWSPGEGPVDASDEWLPGTDAGADSTPTSSISAVESAPPIRTDDEPPAQSGDGARPPLSVVPTPSETATGETATPETATGQTATTAIDAAPPAAVEEEEPPRYRSTPSWPPPDARKGPLIVFLCFLVIVVLVALLITNGRIGGDDSDATVPAAQRPVLATDSDAVPRDWVTYRHARADLQISHPPSWTVTEQGREAVLRDPASGAELVIDYRDADEDPQEVLLEEEREFSARHPQDYRRLQLSPANFMGKVAALWEYTYSEGPAALHAVDLTFHSDGTEVVLTFRAAAAQWESMLPLFHNFLSSVRPPG